VKKARLTLTSSEISRARNRGLEVEVGDNEEVNLWHCQVFGSSTRVLVDFLKTISDLNGYSEEELEDYYIKEVK
jgi:hypothetical protein